MMHRDAGDGIAPTTIEDVATLMDWRTKYYLRGIYQKVMGTVPFAYRLQELLKTTLGYAKRRASDDTLLHRIETNLGRFNRHQIPPPKVVIEQGTGWTGVDLVLFYLGGADRILTYDTTPWLNPETFQRSIDVGLQHHDKLATWNGLQRAVLDERVELLQRHRSLPFADLLQRLNIHYHVRRDFRYAEAENDSVDLFYSYSVLQRVHMSDIRQLFEQSHRALKPGGKYCHRVHTRDIGATFDQRVPDLYFLTFSDAVWPWITSRYLNYQNRLRIFEFEQLLSDLSYQEFEREAVEVTEEGIQFAEQHLKERYGQHDPKEVAIWQADLVGTKV